MGQLVFELLATILLSLGITVYIAGGLGSSPYDAILLILQKHGMPNFAVARISLDLACCILTLLLQLIMGFANAPVESRIGLGSILTVFCTGPFVRFFHHNLIKKNK